MSPKSVTALADSASLDIKTCSASNLAHYLLEHRFGGNEMKVTEFLLEAVSDLPNAQAISDELIQSAQEQQDEDNEKDQKRLLGNELLEQPASAEVSLIVPRVKATATWHRHGIHFQDKKQDSFILTHGDAVERMILFPKPEDCNPKKTLPPDLALLVLKKDVVFKNKIVKQVCLQLPTTLPVWRKRLDNDDDEDDLNDWSNLDHSDQWIQVFCQSLGLDSRTQTARVINPCSSSSAATITTLSYQFESHQEENTSTTTGGMPYVKCYHGVNDGVLYPMKEGLLFFKPPLFIPRSALHSIACGRQGDNGRYVDLTIDLDDGNRTMEFTNIHKCELSVMRDYIHKTLIPAVQKDANGDEQSNENDEVLVAEAMIDESETSQTTTSRGQKRRASLEARAVNKRVQRNLGGDDNDEEDDDDDDYGDESDSDNDGMSEEEEESGRDEDNEDQDEDERSEDGNAGDGDTESEDEE